MTGGRFSATTSISNGRSVASAMPSVTVIAMFAYRPAAAGVPDRRPVDALKVAHDGLLLIRNLSVCPSASDALGWKAYAVPAVTLAGGVPLILGAAFDGSTVIEKGGRAAVAIPSLTVIVMPL